jgi:hypothetical protein
VLGIVTVGLEPEFVSSPIINTLPPLGTLKVDVETGETPEVEDTTGTPVGVVLIN